jgi:DNA end-binding protein Ku
MARAIWKGAINFGLVAIPVKLVAAARPDELRLHYLHAKDGGRIHNERVCEVCGKRVAWSDIVHGYERKKNQYVVLTDEDLKKANVHATQSVDIVQFAAGDQIDSTLFDTPYYLEAEKRGQHAYALLRDVLKQSGRMGIARVVIRTREHLAALKPHGELLVLQLMHWAHEIVDPKTLQAPDRRAFPSTEMKAARMLVDSMTADFDATKFRDQYRDDLMKFIEARARGKEPEPTKKEQRRAEVVDLADLLRRSLQGRKPSRPRSGPRGRKHAKKAAA